MEKKYKSIEAQTHGLLEQLQSKFYGKDTLNNYRKIFKTLHCICSRIKYLHTRPKSGMLLLRITLPLMK